MEPTSWRPDEADRFGMTSTISLSIVHPWDPWKQAIGGFDTCLDGILRTMPVSWPMEVIGFSADVEARPVGRWMDLEFAGRPVRFFAALSNPNPNQVEAVPLSLRFVLGCRRWRVRPSGRIVEFHRFESGLGISRGSERAQVYFLHNHPPEETRRTQNSVRWKHLRGLRDAILFGRLGQASLVVALDPRTPAWLAGHLPGLRDRTTILPEWSDPSVFNLGTAADRKEKASRLRAALHLPAESKVVLFAGRLEQQKDPLLLLNAFGALARLRSDVFLLIVGDGAMAGQVDSAIDALALGERTRRTPSVGRGDLADAFRSCDVLAVTSAFEGGPRTAFEALACGTPVVSFDCGQIGPLLERSPGAGVVVHDRSDQAFAAGLAQALDWTADADLAGRCAQAVRDHVPERALAEIIHRYRGWA
jgi:glycosyltransferase involved in cell wall biosynthesis